MRCVALVVSDLYLWCAHHSLSRRWPTDREYRGDKSLSRVAPFVTPLPYVAHLNWRNT